jgi:Trypsin
MTREAMTPRTPIAAAVLMAFSVLLMAIATPARAIVNGELAGDRYPAVGMTVFQPSNGEPLHDACTGFLISPTAFVTAGHCAVEALADQSEIGGTLGASFEPAFDPATSTFVRATSVVVHPEFLANQLSYKSPDMAVLTLARPVNGVNPIDLPRRGAANGLAQGTKLTAVGYGLTQECDTDLGNCQIVYDPARRFATERLSSVSQWFITVGQNPNAQGEGGVCYGDSGGPHLLSGTTTAVALTTAINPTFPRCWANSRDIRLDTATALDFLRPYAR